MPHTEIESNEDAVDLTAATAATKVRKPRGSDLTKAKIFTAASTRVRGQEYALMAIPYNDPDGNRQKSYYKLSIDSENHDPNDPIQFVRVSESEFNSLSRGDTASL